MLNQLNELDDILKKNGITTEKDRIFKFNTNVPFVEISCAIENYIATELANGKTKAQILSKPLFISCRCKKCNPQWLLS